VLVSRISLGEEAFIFRIHIQLGFSWWIANTDDGLTALSETTMDHGSTMGQPTFSGGQSF
jgi:hypothetical protein